MGFSSGPHSVQKANFKKCKSTVKYPKNILLKIARRNMRYISSLLIMSVRSLGTRPQNNYETCNRFRNLQSSKSLFYNERTGNRMYRQHRTDRIFFLFTFILFFQLYSHSAKLLWAICFSQRISIQILSTVCIDTVSIY